MAVRKLWSLFAIVSVLVAGSAAAFEHKKTVEIPEVADLSREAALSKEKKLPILLMFAAEYCHYCQQVEEDFLKPMLLSGDYDDKVIIRRLHIDQLGDLRDFDGNVVAIPEFTARYGISVTPTLLFLDHQGRQLTDRIVGIGTPDFFGGYLDAAIDASLDQLRSHQPEAKSVESAAGAAVRRQALSFSRRRTALT